jgi:hypothetical protein
LVFSGFAAINPFLGGFLGFVLAFFVAAFLLRFSVSIPAVCHSNRSIIDSFGFSYRNVTWRRAFKLLLTAIICCIALFVLAIVLGLAMSGFSGSSMGIFVSQILQMVIMSIMGAFIYSGMSTLYFRYSEDQSDEDNLAEHLVSDH